MSIKQFDKQKEELSLEITKIILLTPNILTQVKLTDVVDQLKELQPPKPTCSSCKSVKKLTQHYSQTRNITIYRCKKFEAFRDIDLPNNFGCRHHKLLEIKDE